jgi:hypothetical protein
VRAATVSFDAHAGGGGTKGGPEFDTDIFTH